MDRLEFGSVTIWGQGVENGLVVARIVAHAKLYVAPPATPFFWVAFFADDGGDFIVQSRNLRRRMRQVSLDTGEAANWLTVKSKK